MVIAQGEESITALGMFVNLGLALLLLLTGSLVPKFHF